MPAFRVKLGVNDLNYVNVLLNLLTHSLSDLTCTLTAVALLSDSADAQLRCVSVCLPLSCREQM